VGRLPAPPPRLFFFFFSEVSFFFFFLQDNFFFFLEGLDVEFHSLVSDVNDPSCRFRTFTYCFLAGLLSSQRNPPPSINWTHAPWVFQALSHGARHYTFRFLFLPIHFSPRYPFTLETSIYGTEKLFLSSFTQRPLLGPVISLISCV